MVTAKVVRVIAAVSGPARTRARGRTGPSLPALAISGRIASGACGASRRNSSRVGAGTLAGIGALSSRVIARASRAVGPSLVGVDAWPPRPSTVSSMDVTPFSVTPTTPTGLLRPGKASEAIAPPSSTTIHGWTPRLRSSSTAIGAAWPNTSSSQPNDSQTSWAGVCPCSSRSSTASQTATSWPLSSSVPRPQIEPSAMSPENAPCCQSPSTGTTSRCAISTTGLSALVPRQWNSRPCVWIRVRSRCSCRSGNWARSSSTKPSNASVSCFSGSR